MLVEGVVDQYQGNPLCAVTLSRTPNYSHQRQREVSPWCCIPDILVHSTMQSHSAHTLVAPPDAIKTLICQSSLKVKNICSKFVRC